MVSVGDRDPRPDTVKCRVSERRGTLGYTNNKRKTLALLTAVATLAGGLTAGTAYAGGEGGNRPGTGGSGAATQFWAYKDTADGSWGSSTDLNSVARAMKAVGVTMDDSSGKAAAALADANRRFPPAPSGRGRRRLPRRRGRRGLRQRVHHQRMERIRHRRREYMVGQLEQVRRTRRLQLRWNSSL